MINPCFTAGKQSGVWNCHAACGRLKTTIFTSTVYGSYNVISNLDLSVSFLHCWHVASYLASGNFFKSQQTESGLHCSNANLFRFFILFFPFSIIEWSMVWCCLNVPGMVQLRRESTDCWFFLFLSLFLSPPREKLPDLFFFPLLILVTLWLLVPCSTVHFCHRLCFDHVASETLMSVSCCCVRWRIPSASDVDSESCEKSFLHLLPVIVTSWKARPATFPKDSPPLWHPASTRRQPAVRTSVNERENGQRMLWELFILFFVAKSSLFFFPIIFFFFFEIKLKVLSGYLVEIKINCFFNVVSKCRF